MCIFTRNGEREREEREREGEGGRERGSTTGIGIIGIIGIIISLWMHLAEPPKGLAATSVLLLGVASGLLWSSAKLAS